MWRSAVFLSILACGGRQRPPEKVPTKEQVRDFYGLNAESCWLYRYTESGANLLLSITVSGPNDRVIAGEVVYIVKFIRITGGGLPDEWYLDAEENAEIRLRRSVVGSSEQTRVTSRYEDVAPLFAKLILEGTEAKLEVGERFQTDATPLDKDGNPAMLEQHRWTVQAEGEMVATPSGMAESIALEYRKTTGAETDVGTYNLVPGFGYARFTDFDGRIYQVCDARVCDSTAACTGASACGNQCPM
jgi:hypothetical protein